MSDKKAVIKIGADVKDAKDGINQITQQLNALSKEAKNSSFSKFVSSFSALGRSVEFATNGIKKINESIKENIELARKQQKAEVQLQAAAKNNPYLTEASVIQLKKYAEELQNISTTGDEELLPMMSQLAAAGRTQAEIQDIMSAALDLSASGMMSMESAVSALNGTLQGNAGTLGRQIAGLKDLTAEELKSGKAIEIIRKQFDGMSESISAQTGGWQKYKNSIGDFKEVLGSGWANLQNSVGNVLSGFFDSITSRLKIAKKKAEEFKAELNLIAANNGDSGTAETLQSEMDMLLEQNKQYEKYKTVLNTSKRDFIAFEKEKQEELQKTYNRLLEEQQKYVEANQDMWAGAVELMANAEYVNEEFIKQHPEMVQMESDLEKQGDAVKRASREWKALQDECNQMGYTADVLDKRIRSNAARIDELAPKLKEAQTLAGNREAEETVLAETAARDKLRLQYDQTIQKKKEEIEIRRQAGVSISKEEEAQQLLNTAIDAYVKMMGSPEFKGNKGNYVHETEARKAIQIWTETVSAAEEAKKEIKDLETESDNLLKQAAGYIKQNSDIKLSETINAEIAALEEYIKKLDETGEAYKALSDKKNELARLQTEVQKKELEEQVQTTKDKMAEITEVITTYVDKFAEITNSITALVRQNNEAENEEAMTALSEQYTNGIISYKEYCDKKAELDKKAAQEEYKLKMWEWTASFLQATANIAQGVAKALAEGGPFAGPILAALVGASGAIQIATIVANKPKPPSFASGGIVQGSSYSGDKIQANVNSGEMILNARQQRALWDMANGSNGTGAVINMPVNIQNNSEASVKTEMSTAGLLILIDKHINAEMARGTYTQSMNIAHGKAQGASYL